LAHKLSKLTIWPRSLKVFIFLTLSITWREQTLNKMLSQCCQALQGSWRAKAVLLTPRDNRWNATVTAFVCRHF